MKFTETNELRWIAEKNAAPARETVEWRGRMRFS